ncbi:hypothetical protein B0A48_07799 [Cryoendolithus antarcticus]|uniref:Cyanovirin-N domain-containing protein n=1 Tax=Cryoendolithus antarcticus TaxID=1507870 RepID=A0A1V8T7D2_9PEZI|nr:hypothetical protein B0A48_07799 [Cryoendolithus antarcticus]
MQFTAPCATVLLLDYLSLTASAKSGWAKTCGAYRLLAPYGGRGWALLASCEVLGGNEYNEKAADISLNTYFGNSHGRFVGQLNGGFSPNCMNVQLSGTTLLADCGDGGGGYPATSIDTNQWIGNTIGQLYCLNTNHP